MKRNALRALALAFALFLLLDVVVFSRYGYFRYVKPDSYAGKTEQSLRALQAVQASGKTVHCAVLGDSRMGEGFSAKICNTLSGRNESEWVSASIGGSTPRIWYWMMRRMDAMGIHPTYVVIPLQSYSGKPSGPHYADRILDLQYTPTLVPRRYALSFMMTYSSSKHWGAIFLSVLLKSFALKSDITSFWEDPAKRYSEITMQDVRDRSRYNYRGNTNALDCIVSLQGESRVYAEGVSEAQKRQLEASLPTVNYRPAEEDFAYTRKWLTRIIMLADSMNTQLVFLRAPRGPFGTCYTAETNVEFKHILPRDCHHHVLDVALFSDLETPEFFFDRLHMNAKGRDVFSRRLYEAVENLPHPSSDAN